MTKKKLYRYLGKNGMITSLVELMNIDYIKMYRLTADAGYLLTNGEIILGAVDIYAEDLDNWHEIPNPNKPDNTNK